MMASLETVVRRSCDLGALGATDEGAAFYRSRGWIPWAGPTSVLGPTGIVRTPDEDGGVYVWPASGPFDPTGALACDWRDGDVW